MAISTYSELKTAVTEWMDRSDISGTAEDLVTLAEAKLNRKLDAVEVTATLTGTASSRNVDVSSLDIIEPMFVYIADTVGGDETEIELKAPASFPFDDTNGEPGYVSLDGDNLVFDRPLDVAYSIRFRYRGRFALSDATPTNDLLTYHPDVYLAACIMWGGVYINDAGKVQGFKSLLDEFIDEAQSHIAQRKRGILSPTPILAALIGNRSRGYTES
tara:strand:- start:2595 stop:3242 length:648 start_codon:yes stop_codon:yes gene_type:complete